VPLYFSAVVPGLELKGKIWTFSGFIFFIRSRGVFKNFLLFLREKPTRTSVVIAAKLHAFFNFTYQRHIIFSRVLAKHLF